MRIALLADGIYPFVVGGMQKHSYYLTKHLVRVGAAVDLYYAVPQDAEPEEGFRFTEEERRFIKTVRVHRPILPYFPSHYLRCSYLVSERLLDAYTAHRSADFIYAQGFSGWKAILAKKRGMPLPPIGVNQHGLEMYQKTVSVRSHLEQRMFRPFVASQLRHADVALSLGGGLNRIIEALGISRSRIVESPNGVGRHWVASEVKPCSSPLRFVFIGRYERRKGVEELHQVLQRLLDHHEFSFHFIGPIPSHLQIKSPKVTYWGLIQEEESVRAIVQQSDVLVCPSYSEGMPTVILEAMASGLCVIASNVGAVDALVSEENGWLIAPGDTESLYAAMREVILLPETALLQKKACGRAMVTSKFLWDAVARQTFMNLEAAL